MNKFIMNPKIAYVLVSKETDYYYERALLSITSLKIHNPNLHVTVIVDNLTADNLVGKRSKIRALIDELIVVPFTASFDNKYRSRWIKTSTRNLIAGDFLLVDTDTIIVDRLDFTDMRNNDFCAVIEHHAKDYFDFRTDRYCRNVAKTLRHDAFFSSFAFLKKQYFNSGVLFVKDTPENRKFFSEWHSLWLEHFNHGLYIDQPALSKTNSSFGHIISELDGTWNCQILSGVNYLATAKIIHTYTARSSQKSRTYFFQEDCIYDEIKSSGCISDVLIQKVLSAKQCFHNKTEVIGDKEVNFRRSTLYSIFFVIFDRFHLLFSFIDFTAFSALRFKKMLSIRGSRG